MQLEEVQQALQESGLPTEQAKGILHLIDVKIENDMEKVLAEISNVNATLSAEMKRIEDKIDTRFNIIIWVLGILIALMAALKFFGK